MGWYDEWVHGPRFRGGKERREGLVAGVRASSAASRPGVKAALKDSALAKDIALTATPAVSQYSFPLRVALLGNQV